MGSLFTFLGALFCAEPCMTSGLDMAEELREAQAVEERVLGGHNGVYSVCIERAGKFYCSRPYKAPQAGQREWK